MTLFYLPQKFRCTNDSLRWWLINKTCKYTLFCQDLETRVPTLEGNWRRSAFKGLSVPKDQSVNSMQVRLLYKGQMSNPVLAFMTLNSSIKETAIDSNRCLLLHKLLHDLWISSSSMTLCTNECHEDLMSKFHDQKKSLFLGTKC